VVAVSVTASPAAAYWRIGADNVFGHLVMSAVVVLGAWTIGVAARGQRAYAAGLRDQATRRAVTEERLRIARELHDVVSHSMSVIAVRAAVAGYVAATPESPAVAALRDIELVSREALLELRHLLGVLRTDGQPDGPDGTELAPTPSLADLDRLVADTARAGADVHLRTSGDVRPLPPGVELSAYRIVQEALTNLVRHARPARGTVALGFRPDRVTIEVTDDGGLDGADPPDRTGGHGLIGMRERVSLYGGTFSAGPLPGHGFRVAATIPLPPVPR
jgi:signal transduction histidine kinase